MVIRKGYPSHTDSYSAFLEADRKTLTGVDGYLASRGIKRLFCVGLATEFCVAWTAIDAHPTSAYAHRVAWGGVGGSDMTNQTGNRSDTVDLQEVSRLVEALERDLDKIRAGSADLETLRKEVEQLRATLDAPQSAHAEIHDGLRAIRALLHRAGDELQRDAIKVTEYVAHVGRMLGM